MIGAYLAYDYAVEFAGCDLEAMFGSVAPLLPLMGVLIGLDSRMWAAGLWSQRFISTGWCRLRRLMGNAISNDGDALFPAIALNPKAAVLGDDLLDESLQCHHGLRVLLSLRLDFMN